jgi:hypothetical protein
MAGTIKFQKMRTLGLVLLLLSVLLVACDKGSGNEAVQEPQGEPSGQVQKTDYGLIVTPEIGPAKNAVDFDDKPNNTVKYSGEPVTIKRPR